MPVLKGKKRASFDDDTESLLLLQEQRELLV
jgi:hypothetical protein